VIYLNVPPHILWERTRHDRSRPLLQVPDPRGRLQQLYAARDLFTAKWHTSSSKVGGERPMPWSG
jgi:shikimate kinase